MSNVCALYGKGLAKGGVKRHRRFSSLVAFTLGALAWMPVSPGTLILSHSPLEPLAIIGQSDKHCKIIGQMDIHCPTNGPLDMRCPTIRQLNMHCPIIGRLDIHCPTIGQLDTHC